MSLDEDLKKMSPVQSGDDQSGCTAIVAIITSTHFIVANAGDARAILMQGDNTVRAMSFDHKPTNPEETTRIEAAGRCVSMRRINGDLAVSRALGDFRFKQNESMPAKDQMVSAFPDIEIAERDGKEQFLLLCCDGIWDVMSNDDAGAFVKKAIEGKYRGELISKVCERLLDKCLEKGSKDNMSAVVVPRCHHARRAREASRGDLPGYAGGRGGVRSGHEDAAHLRGGGCWPLQWANGHCAC